MPAASRNRLIKHIKRTVFKQLCYACSVSALIISPAYSTKIYHCLQANGTKAYQGRPCEQGKKTVSVTEQKTQTSPPKETPHKFSMIGKWVLNGISTRIDGELQTQEEEISWTFSADGQVTYQYANTSNVYDFLIQENNVVMPRSPISVLTVIKHNGDNAIWKAGDTYYFVTLDSII